MSPTRSPAWLVVSVVMAIGACSGGPTAATGPEPVTGPTTMQPGSDQVQVPLPPGVDPNLLTEMEAWAERACACEDYACFVVEMDLANNLHTLKIDWWSDEHRKRGVVARTRASDCGFDKFAAEAGWSDAQTARAAYNEAIVAQDLELLRRLYAAARIYWADHERTAAGPSAGPTPALGTCCHYADGVCPGDDSLWQVDPWSAINASFGEPHRFSFEYEAAKNGEGFTVRGYGDLDCDGEYAIYELRGQGKKTGPSGFPEWKITAAGE